MGNKRKSCKLAWNSETTNSLLQIRDEALIKKREGDSRQLMAIIHADWNKLFPLSKASIGSLKLKLSKLNNLSEHNTTIDQCRVNTSISSPSKFHQRNKCKDKIITRKPDTYKKKGIRINNKMKVHLVECYNIVTKQIDICKKSKREIIKQTRRLWLQKYSDRSISLSYVGGIISKASNYVQKPGTNDVNSGNIPDNTARLRKMRKAGAKLGSEPIYKYICYNCGRLIPKDRKLSIIPTIDQQSLGIPPILSIYDSIGELSYVTSKGKWISCSNCKRGPIDLYNTCDPDSGKLYVPEVLQSLVSPYEKGQIALAGLFSKIVKPRSDKFKVWEHIQGQVKTFCKLDYHYYGMYGFMVQKETEEPMADNILTDVTLRIKRALFWLRKNNPLYLKFYANYDTLYRYDPDKVLHLHKATGFESANHTTVDTHLKEEQSGIVTNLDDSIFNTHLDESNDVAGVQHPNMDHLDKRLHELKQLTKVSYNDPYLEAKLWPHLFPFGNGGWCQDSLLKTGEYLKHKLLNLDARWRKDQSFSFHWYDRQIKSRLFYVAKSRKAKRQNRTDNLTSSKLKEETFYDKLGNIVPATITGSRSYWNSKLLDLLAISKKLGKPTFFITLTQNDNWPEIQNHIINGPGYKQPEIDIDSEFELKDIHPSREFSIETVSAYSNRLKLFKQKVISNPDGPVGKVIDWRDRKEFQSRGAIHNHMVVWCEEGTVPDNAVCAEIPRGAENNPTVNSLKSFVRRLQIHKCRKNKCNINSRGRPLKKCKYGFPFPVQEDEQMNKSGNRFLPRRRCYEDTLVVPYNQEILYLWGAHMNIQKVTESGWEMYLAKYVAKGEPSFQLEISKDASDPEKYLRTRVVGRLEVDHINMGHFLCCASREVIYLPTELSPEFGFLKRKKHLPADPESDDIFYSNILDKYMERPKELEDLLYVEWAEQYMLARSNNANSAVEYEEDELDSDQDNGEINERKQAIPNILTDMKGRKWKKRKTEAASRWKFYMPNGEHQEDYFMQKLIFNIPLRKDTVIISPENKSGSYMEECAIRQLLSKDDDALNALHDARQRGFSLDRLRKMAQCLKDMDWIGDDEFNLFIEEVATVHNSHTEDEQEVLDADVDVDHADLANLAMHSNHIDLEEFEASLSPSQLQAYNYIARSLSGGNQVLAAIIGEAGTGKSYLLKGIVEHAVSELHLRTRKLATTGVAAFLIGGETIHHFFQMDIHCKSRLETGTVEYDIISNTDIIVIDEFSLLEMRPFLTMDKILRSMAPTANQQHMPFE